MVLTPGAAEMEDQLPARLSRTPERAQQVETRSGKHKRSRRASEGMTHDSSDQLESEAQPAKVARAQDTLGQRVCRAAEGCDFRRASRYA